MVEFSDLYIEVDGYNTRYWSCGDANSVILLLHGFAFSVEIWESNIPELSKNYKVIALDLLGFGLTDKPKKRQHINVFPQFVFLFMKKMLINKAHIVGHSMGGLIATRLAQLHPECVESLVLLGSAGFNAKIPLHFRIFSLPFIGEMLIKPNRIGIENALRKNTFNSSVITQKLVNRLYDFSLHPEMGITLLRVVRSAINIFGFKNSIVQIIENEIDKLTMPVLIIWGDSDEIIYLKHAYVANKIIKNSKLVIFKDCGHLPQLEYAEKFNEILQKFFIMRNI